MGGKSFYARELDSIREIDLDVRLILGALVTDLEKLYEIGKKFGYEERSVGYISKCHLCVDIRKHIAQQTDEFEGLATIKRNQSTSSDFSLLSSPLPLFLLLFLQLQLLL